MTKPEKTTDELLNEIRSSKEISDYLESNEDEFAQTALHERICALIKDKGMQKSKVVARSGLNRVYGYQILSGKRVPSRDKLIALCFGLMLDLDETNVLLKYYGFAPLYSRNKRDSVIIFAITNKKSVFTANELLFDNGFEILTA